MTDLCENVSPVWKNFACLGKLEEERGGFYAKKNKIKDITKKFKDA